MFSEPVLLSVDLVGGAMSGRTGIKRSRIADLAGIYADAAAFAGLVEAHGGEVAYEVHEFRPTRAVPQDLIFGTSTLQPGKVGAEFFITRGHIHAQADRPEIYLCQRGRGVMHMEAPDGRTMPMEMVPGTLVYVAPHWVHRSVNVGAEPFVTVFCYPADAGQDYGVVKQACGMRTLIVDDGAGGWMEVDNPRYRPRSTADQQRYMPA